MRVAVIAVPARNEERRIGAALQAVGEAAVHAVDSGLLDGYAVVLGAHRCSDDTVSVAQSLPRPDGTGLVEVYPDHESVSVGGVRGVLLDRALNLHRRAEWIFNTDADSLVPPDWITATLTQAKEAGAVAVAGMVDLEQWRGPARVHRRYRDIVANGVSGLSHSHVYGANLAVRVDAYRAVGGFAERVHGEDHDLVTRLRGAGLRVLSTLSPVVTTSARHPARAPAGLGALIDRLAADELDNTDDVA